MLNPYSLSHEPCLRHNTRGITYGELQIARLLLHDNKWYVYAFILGGFPAKHVLKVKMLTTLR